MKVKNINPIPKRIESLDILRGMSLLGIILAHYILCHLAGPRPLNFNSNFSDPLNRVIVLFNQNFVASKFYGIFAFLFGVGFIIQSESFKQNYKNPKTLCIRRFWLLGVFGLIHQMIWMGDILVIYTPLAFALLFFEKASNKSLLIIAIICLINIPGIALQIFDSRDVLFNKMPFPSGYASYSKKYMTLIESGSLKDLLIFNIKGIYGKLWYQIDSGRIFLTFGYFVLGAYVGRRKIYLEGEQELAIKISAAKYSGIVALIFMFIVHVVNKNHYLDTNNWGRNPLQYIYECLIVNIANIAGCVFYISGASVLITNKKWGNFFHPFSALGKTALTNYILQSIIALLLFYNIAGGMFLYESPANKYLLAICIFVIQIILSNVWMKHFEFGPIEWLWRSGVLLKWQKFRKKPIKTSSFLENSVSSL